MTQSEDVIWMADFAVESHICLAESHKTLSFSDPQKRFTINLRNGRTSFGEQRPSIFASVIFKSKADGLNANVKQLKTEATIFLKEFLATLSLVIKAKLEIINCLRIVDWRPGIENRLVHQFKIFPDADLPEPLLSPQHIHSAEFFSEREHSEKLEKAVRWFWRGINSTYFEDQFQCFWFAMEILAAHLKPSDRVPDKCSKCQSPLFCSQCNEVPMHKPFNKQAIEYLLRQKRPGRPDEVTIKQLFEIRNRLMHGDFMEEIESSMNLSMQNMNDHLGNFIWSLIISAFKFEPKEIKAQIEFLQPSTLSHRQLVTHITAELGTPVGCDIHNPDPRHFTGIQIDMKVFGDSTSKK